MKDGQPETSAEETISDPIVAADGKFNENWRETLEEDIRNEKCLQTFGDINGMAKTLVHQARMVGKDKVVLPDDKSPDTSWDEFYKAVGRPDTPEDYGFAEPEDFPEGLYDSELSTAAASLFHKIGLTPKQAKAIFDFHNEASVSALAKHGEQKEAERLEADRELKDKLGVAYDERIHFANRVINEFTQEGEDREAFLAKYGNDPDFIDFAGRVASKFVEHKVVIADKMNKLTPSNALAKAEELRNTPGYISGELSNTSPARYKAITDEIAALYNIAYPEKAAG